MSHFEKQDHIEYIGLESSKPYRSNIFYLIAAKKMRLVTMYYVHMA